MIAVNIVTNNVAANSRAFNFPLLLNKEKFLKKNIDIKLLFIEKNVKRELFSKSNSKFFDCDILGINAKSIHFAWKNYRNYLFEFLELVKKSAIKIIWFDTYDSTVSTEFAVLPYVDLYLKNQIHKKKELYLNQSSRERCYVTYLNRLYGIKSERNLSWVLPEKNDLSKIGVSWNTCFENYTKNRYSIPYRFYQKFLRPNQMWPLINTINFKPIGTNRNIDISYRVNKKYRWQSITEHRNNIAELLKSLNVPCSKVPLSVYWEELENSKISIGPFGFGEITLRDFEIIITGSTLVKPDLSHIETWPPLFQENITYLPFKWDLSDLKDVLKDLIVNEEKRKSIARKAQSIYRKYLMEDEKTNYFVDHFDKIVNRLQQ